MELDLKEHISSKDKKQRYVNRLFETIAPRYDLITRLLSYGMDRGWKRKLISMAAPARSEAMLDLACGTGDITFALAGQLAAGRVVGLDITQGMLGIAERKRDDLKVENINFVRADIMKIPFRDESFDCVTAGYALRNVPDIEAALSEIQRVLRPGGRFYSLDFAHPRSKLYRWLYLRYLIVAGSVVGLALHGDADTYRYIPETLKLYPGQRGVRDMMDRAGFARTGFHEFGGGIMAINYGIKPL
jgi:demethylmenaquinone methyltransferase / 2-methoxy-6-polyprenyl-1,4-benzoquinol methylase